MVVRPYPCILCLPSDTPTPSSVSTILVIALPSKPKTSLPPSFALTRPWCTRARRVGAACSRCGMAREWGTPGGSARSHSRRAGALQNGGGGVYANGGSVTLTDSTISGCSAEVRPRGRAVMKASPRVRWHASPRTSRAARRRHTCREALGGAEGERGRVGFLQVCEASVLGIGPLQSK